MTKSGLAISLSRLESFSDPKLMKEQYSTDSETAADLLWFAYMQGDIETKVIADLGAGTGILGIGCCLLGAKKCYLVENDPEAIISLKKNIEVMQIKNAEIVESDVASFAKKADAVVQNPPFGTKARHADREFLEKAFSIAKVVYSLHKSSTRKFVEAIAKDRGFSITNRIKYMMPLKATHSFHRKKIQRIEVELYRLKSA
ncbi:methyltransferase [Candidatus Woesearchaeota archaeon]|nr:methyltransferase [Candidatus Woesearchaeota archaeon]